MKVYVASSCRNQSQPVVVQCLRSAGHEVYDFKNPAPGDHGFSWKQCEDDPPPWSAEKTREVLMYPVSVRGFGLDFEAMKHADAVVMLQPCGRSAALELGWACGAGKLTIALLADGQEPELMLKLADHICTTLGEVIALLAPLAPQAECRRWCIICHATTNGHLEYNPRSVGPVFVCGECKSINHQP